VLKINEKKRIGENNGGGIDKNDGKISDIQNRRRKTWDKVMLLKLWKGCRQRRLNPGL
jgi:hypothetical protein